MKKSSKGITCWAILKKGKLCELFVGYPSRESALAWAWANGSRREYRAGIELPRDYYRAVKCGYELVIARVTIGSDKSATGIPQEARYFRERKDL